MKLGQKITSPFMLQTGRYSSCVKTSNRRDWQAYLSAKSGDGGEEGEMANLALSRGASPFRGAPPLGLYHYSRTVSYHQPLLWFLIWARTLPLSWCFAVILLARHAARCYGLFWLGGEFDASHRAKICCFMQGSVTHLLRCTDEFFFFSLRYLAIVLLRFAPYLVQISDSLPRSELDPFWYWNLTLAK